MPADSTPHLLTAEELERLEVPGKWTELVDGRAFFDAGGRMIDSTPMYGSAQQVVGYGLAKLRRPPTLLSARTRRVGWARRRSLWRS